MTKLLPWRRKTEDRLDRLQDEVNMLERFLGQESNFDLTEGLEIDDRDDELVVRADVPGFEPNELDVQISGPLLTIKAEKAEEKKRGNGQERTYRSFQRSVTVPQGVKADEIKAKYRNGVLELHLPKTEEAKPKRISVAT